MRVAFLGNAHIHTLDYARASIDDVRAELVGAACTEPTPYNLPSNVPVFGSAAELPEHDLCVVTSDIASHPDLLAQVRAPHVFVEKPIGADEDSAREVARIVSTSGAAFHTGLFLRHGKPVRDLRSALHKGTIGAVREIDLTYAHHGLTAGWLRDWSAHLDGTRMGYGVFGDLAAHLIDLARWCMGPLEAESCELTTEAGTDVAGHATLRTSGGVPVGLTAGALADDRDLTLRFTGDAGTLAIMDDALVIERSGTDPELLTEVADLTPEAGFCAVLDAVADGQPSNGASLEDAVAVNVVLDALYARAARSARSPALSEASS